MFALGLKIIALIFRAGAFSLVSSAVRIQQERIKIEIRRGHGTKRPRERERESALGADVLGLAQVLRSYVG